ncbi:MULTISPECIES: OmpA family protein [Vibrio]|uniref:OmpA family protein n=2 Tax=Vibrio TaxID=662 RepID=A0A7X4LJ68_9VIBR|nr:MULTISPECIES: OmpA family protein [Vibrio]MBF9002448.1 OmpA family protein [Vibrio nitrifigilis]MZI92973.1 OmpA family protein [Vibrio eleionomae]
MKYLFLLLSVILSGCSSLGMDNFDSLTKMMSGSKLDVAPKDASAVRNPDWGTPPVSQQQVTRPVVVTNYSKLIRFLQQNHIDYKVIPGKYMMVYIEDTIHFKINSDKVLPRSYPWMQNLSYFLAHNPAITVVVNGHTDTTGTYALNDNLSERRAKSIQRMLRQMQVPKESIYTRGYGEYIPECTNLTRSGRQCNRRVELLFIVDGTAS